MTPKILILTALAVAFPAAASTVSAVVVYDHDRFQLWNDCQPIPAIVTLYGEALPGITQGGVETLVRSRFRAARLYVDRAEAPAFELRVGLTDVAFSFSARFAKFVTDPRIGVGAWAPSWQDGHFGTHGSDISRIQATLAQMVDAFIDEYLRVNAPACR